MQETYFEKALQDVATLGELDVSAGMLAPNNRAEAEQTLTEMIAFLIDHNFEKLLWILYRIDVDEQKAKQLLAQHLPEEAPALLAALILQREEKKQEVRESFKNMQQADDDDDLRL